MNTQVHNATLVHRHASKPKPKRGLAAKLAMGGMAGLGLCLIAAVIAIITYALRGNLSVSDRPLVLIHAPLDREQLSEGDGVLVHATARSADGIRRVELWADDVLVAERQSDQGDLPTSMVLSADWVPASLGNHRLVVRATSANDAKGQSSITIETVEADEPEPADAHTVQAGETLASIADGYGTTAEDLAASNPSLDPSGPAPGDELVIPSGEPPSDSGDPLPTDDEAPSAAADSPAPLNLFFGVFGILETFGSEEPGEPTGLRVELISLRTPMAYENLNCYVGLADQPPLRYPDLDGDQSTDESFSVMSGVGGDGVSWNVGEYLSGDNVPTFFWPANQSLPFDISCVGITGGGTQALQLGHTEKAIPPEDWDGIVRYADVVGAEGSYTVGYRVVRTDDAPRGEPKWIDPDMASPTDLMAVNYNAILGPETGSDDDSEGPTASSFTVTENDPFALLWRYEPDEDDVPITGFRIYMNGNLQWTERLDRRLGNRYYTVFPPQWRHPPCGEEYVLTVSAWSANDPDPDGVESPPADPPIIFETPDDECERWVSVTFETLETYDLGGDGRYDHQAGDVGPPYGHFWANGESTSFDTGSLDDHFAPLGLLNNWSYSLMEMAATPEWGFHSRPYFVVAVPEGEYLEVGFRIMDEDDGRCRDSDDPGCDDVICEGSVYGLADLQYFREEGIMSDNGRCHVTYTRRPAFGTPAEAGGEWGEPLPWIHVEEVEIDGGSGEVLIHIQNTGSAAWSMRDLQVELQTRSGESLGMYVWPDFSLDIGQRITLGQPSMTVGAPYDACVVIDPNDAVLEEYERSGAMIHTPVCPHLPDLTITNVAFDGDTDGQIRVTVQNIGDGPLDGRNLSLDTYLPDSSPADVVGVWRDVMLDENQVRTFNLPVTVSDRDHMADGYTVVVNERNLFTESNPDNNSYTVGPTQQLQLFWCNRHVPHMGGLTSDVHMFFASDVLSGAFTQRVLDTSWSNHLSGEEVRADQDHNYSGRDVQSCAPVSELFSIAGDQWLRVTFQAEYQSGNSGSFDSIGTIEHIHAPQNGWDAGRLSEFGVRNQDWIACRDTGRMHFLRSAPFQLGTLESYTWDTSYLVCQLEP
ncbi:MAG: LysM peptidoglycan-binding domain-containing protein [Anaerolineae bacterium]|nr:LysM peptidoglycan-binding domain-containing protein [Anaerolineae bacterium]